MRDQMDIEDHEEEDNDDEEEDDDDDDNIALGDNAACLKRIGLLRSERGGSGEDWTRLLLLLLIVVSHSLGVVDTKLLCRAKRCTNCFPDDGFMSKHHDSIIFYFMLHPPNDDTSSLWCFVCQFSTHEYS